MDWDAGRAVNPQPSTLSPQLQISNTKPSTMSPKPASTLNPQPVACFSRAGRKGRIVDLLASGRRPGRVGVALLPRCKVDLPTGQSHVVHDFCITQLKAQGIRRWCSGHAFSRVGRKGMIEDLLRSWGRPGRVGVAPSARAKVNLRDSKSIGPRRSVVRSGAHRSDRRVKGEDSRPPGQAGQARACWCSSFREMQSQPGMDYWVMAQWLQLMPHGTLSQREWRSGGHGCSVATPRGVGSRPPGLAGQARACWCSSFREMQSQPGHRGRV